MIGAQVITPQERLVLEERLLEATAAYHEITLGRGVRTLVDQNGERIEYQMTNLGALARYIEQLKRQLGLLPAGSDGPMRVLL